MPDIISQSQPRPPIQYPVLEQKHRADRRVPSPCRVMSGTSCARPTWLGDGQLDYESRQAELESSDNPFAIVVLAHLQSQRERNNPEGRLLGKLVLIRRLYERGYERQAILDLFRFIDWVLELPEDLEIRFEAELGKLEEERRMRHVTSIERRGIQKGIQQEANVLLKRLLNRRFGELSDWVETRLADASREELEYWVERVSDAQRLEEVFIPE